jgi:hypothetical protein
MRLLYTTIGKTQYIPNSNRLVTINENIQNSLISCGTINNSDL